MHTQKYTVHKKGGFRIAAEASFCLYRQLIGDGATLAVAVEWFLAHCLGADCRNYFTATYKDSIGLGQIILVGH